MATTTLASHMELTADMVIRIKKSTYRVRSVRRTFGKRTNTWNTRVLVENVDTKSLRELVNPSFERVGVESASEPVNESTVEPASESTSGYTELNAIQKHLAAALEEANMADHDSYIGDCPCGYADSTHPVWKALMVAAEAAGLDFDFWCATNEWRTIE